MSMCIMMWIISLDSALEAAAAEFLKPRWRYPGWVFWLCLPCWQNQSAAGWKAPLDGLWSHPLQSRASFSIKWGHARPCQVFSISKEQWIHSLSGALFQCLTTLMVKNVFLKSNYNDNLQLLPAALSLRTSDKESGSTVSITPPYVAKDQTDLHLAFFP